MRAKNPSFSLSSCLCVLALAGVYFLIPNEANASFGEVFDNIVIMVTGNLGKGLATLAVITIGLMAMFAKIEWKNAILVGIGISIVFGAASIYKQFEFSALGPCPTIQCEFGTQKAGRCNVCKPLTCADDKHVASGSSCVCKNDVESSSCGQDGHGGSTGQTWNANSCACECPSGKVFDQTLNACREDCGANNSTWDANANACVCNSMTECSNGSFDNNTCECICNPNAREECLNNGGRFFEDTYCRCNY